MLKNVQIHVEGRVADPTLYEVISKLALLKPNLTFVHDAKVNHMYNARPFDKSAPHTDGVTYATVFRVFDNNVLAGNVRIDSHYSRRSGARPWRIGVTSHLIQNSRGSRNTAYTSDVTKAVALCKKVLSAKTHGRILYEQYQHTVNAAQHVIRDLTSPIARGHFLTSSAAAQILLYNYMSGSVDATNRGLDTAMRAKIMTPEFAKSLSEYYLAEYFRELFVKNQTVFVHRFGDQYGFFTDAIPDNEEKADTTPITLMEFDALPIHTQEKIGVLQLMQTCELIKDVGIRTGEDSFLLM